MVSELPVESAVLAEQAIARKAPQTLRNIIACSANDSRKERFLPWEYVFNDGFGILAPHAL